MTAVVLRHWRRDGPLGLFLAACLLAISAFLAGTGLQHEAQTQGWRRVDTAAILKKISAGDLQDREALWYHAVSDELPGIGRR